MIAVLLLDAKRGPGIVWTYVAAWTGAIAVVLVALLAGVGAITDSGSEGVSEAAALLELSVGFLLLAFGLRRILGGTRATITGETRDPDATTELPGWLQAIENISYIAAFLLGIYSATYPLVIAAAGEILRADVDMTQTVALALLFIVLGSSSVLAVAALGTFAPHRSARHLERMRGWLTLHNRAVVTAILLVLGVLLSTRGLAGLL